MPISEGESIEGLIDQIDTIAGSNDETSGGEGTQKHQSLKKYVVQLKPEQREGVEGLTTAVKRLSKAEKKLKKEADEKEKMPSHNEIAEIYENSILKDRLKLDLALIRRAFEANGKAKPGSASGFPELRLDHIDELVPQTIGDESWDEIRRAEGAPRIFFTSIYEEKGFLKKKPENTGQVLVVMSMNNGNTPDENTVVTMLVKHDGGKLLWGDNNLGLYRVQSESDYRHECEILSPTADSLLARGEITVEKYKARFVKEGEHKTLDKYWIDKDAELTKLPPSEDAHRGEKLEGRRLTETKRKEMLEGLSGEYTKRLQELRRVEAQIIELTKSRVAEIEARNRRLMESEDFENLIFLLNSNVKDKKAIAVIKGMMIRQHGVDLGYLNALIAERTRPTS